MIYLKEALHFKYVRFWNIFSEDMLIDVHGEGEHYNFSRLDSILDFLLQHGLKPHIELGMKPRRLYQNVQNALILEGNDAEFPGREQWKSVMNALMRHLLHRYGRAELAQWRMELWFRENTDRYRMDDIEGYYELFDLTYEIIHSYCSELKVGGCGYRQGYDKAGGKFWEEWTKRNISRILFRLFILHMNREKSHRINTAKDSQIMRDYSILWRR